jgi:hypothetical protein
MHRHVVVGDRFIRGSERITVSKIEGACIHVQVMTGTAPGSPVWTSVYALPLDDTWVKVGSGPAEKCPTCLQEDLEPGEMLCWTCAGKYAEGFAGAPGIGTAARVAVLRIQAEEERSGD